MPRKKSLETEIPDDILSVFLNKLKTGKFALSLGSYAYSPANKELTKWFSSDGGEVKASLQELIDGWAPKWYIDEIYRLLEDEDWNKLFSKSNMSQDEYETHFLKNMSTKEVAKNVKKISEELLLKKTATYILETRKKLNNLKNVVVTISDVLEDMSKEDVVALGKQLDHGIAHLTKLKSKVLK
jgi:hypothetical protein